MHINVTNTPTRTTPHPPPLPCLNCIQCTSHYDLATGYSDFYSWVWQSLYDPHGPVHIWVGGVLDCEKTYERIEGLVGKMAASQLAEQSFIHRKNLYRDGIFKCDGRADVAQSSEEVR